MAGPGTAAGRRLLVVAANPSIDRLYEVDRLEPGGIHRPRSAIAVPGGKGLNAARAAATLGGRVTAVAILGGRAGDWIVDGLAERGLDARVVRAGGETRTCVSILDRSSGALTEVYEAGSAIDGGCLGRPRDRHPKRVGTRRCRRPDPVRQPAARRAG